MFVHNFANYVNKDNQHQLHSISNHWRFDHFVDIANYDKIWFDWFCTKHKYSDSQFFLDVMHYGIFEMQ